MAGEQSVSGDKLRFLLIVFGLLAALVVGLLFAAPVLVDAGSYRSDIEAVATRAAGQPVQINGAVSFRILPTPRLVAENITIAPPTSLSELQPLLTADRADLLLSAGDLVAGRVAVDRIALTKPNITVHTGLAGHSNLVLSGKDDLPLRNVRIEQGVFLLLDEKRDRELRISDLSGEVATSITSDSRSAAFSGKWNGRPTTLKGRLTSSDRPSVALDLVVQDLGEAIFKGRLDLTDGWSATGELTLSSPDLSGGFPLLSPDGSALPVLPLKVSGQARFAAREFAIDGLAGEIGSTAFGGRVEVQDDGIVEVDASISFEQLDGPAILPWARDMAERAVAGELDLPDSDAVRARFQLDAGLVAFPGGFLRQLSSTARYADGVLEVERFAVLMPGGSDFAFAGNVRLSGGAFRLAGSTELGSDNLAALLQATGAPVRSEGHGRLRNFGLSARLLVDSSVAQVSDIDLRFDQSRVTGGVAVALVKRPSFSLNLEVDQFNANAYSDLLETGGGQFDLLHGDPANPSMPWLSGFDTNATLRVGRLIAGGSVVRGLDLDASLIAGVLDLKSLQIDDLDGASVTLTGRVDTPENPQWLLQGEFASGGPGRMFGGLLGQSFPVLARSGDLTVRFGLEGGPARSAADIDMTSATWQLRLSGLVSQMFLNPELDLDASLSASSGRRVLARAFPGWRLPRGFVGPLQAEGQLKGSLDQLQIDGRIDAMSARAEVQGRIADLSGEAPHYSLRSRIRHGDLGQLLLALNQDRGVVTGEPMPLDLSFRAEGGESQTSLADIAVSVGQRLIGASSTIDWTADLPRVELVVNSGAFAMESVQPASVSGARAAVEGDNRALRWSRLPLDWAWMRQLNLVGSAELATLDAFGLHLTDAHFGFKAGPGGWAVENLSAQLGEGRLDIDMSMGLRPVPELNLAANLRGVDVASLVQPFLGRAHEAAGVVSMDVVMNGLGLTEYDLVRSLTGQIDVRHGTSLLWSPEVLMTDLQGTLKLAGGVVRAAPALANMKQEEGGTILGSLDLGGWLADIEVRSGSAGAEERFSISGPMQDLSLR